MNSVPRTVLEQFAQEDLPRVELIPVRGKVHDSVTLEELQAESHEFMKGIFYYAGLDPTDATDLFPKNDRTMKQLSQASE